MSGPVNHGASLNNNKHNDNNNKHNDNHNINDNNNNNNDNNNNSNSSNNTMLIIMIIIMISVVLLDLLGALAQLPEVLDSKVHLVREGRGHSRSAATVFHGF